MNNNRHKLSDRTVGNISLLLIILYTVGYGLLVSRGFHFDKLNVVTSSLLVTIFLIDSIKTLLESLKKSEFYRGNQDLSKVTVVIPTKDGGKLLEETIKDLLNRFAPERIIIASNGSIDDTCDRALALGVHVIDHPDAVGKVPAINMALEQVKTPYTLIMDDDTLIGGAIIPTQALDDGYDGVAFRVLPKITNWVTRLQMYEYRKSMDIGRRFHNNSGTVQNISGAIGLFNTHELVRQIKLHTGEFSGEDLQRTLLIHLSVNPKGVIISDSTIETEVPSSIIELYHQRVYGWNPGLLSNLFKYINILLRRKRTPFLLRYEAFYNSILVTGIDPLRLLAFPMIVFYPMYFAMIYVVYVIAETIPYIVMKRKDPYWVVLIYPFYGLFGFITRIVSMAVFIYRRSAVLFRSNVKLDDYKHSNLSHRFTGLMIALVFGSSVTAIPTLYNYNSQSESSTSQPVDIQTYQNPIVEINTTNEEINYLPDDNTQNYELTVRLGEGKTHIARRAVVKYNKQYNLRLNQTQLQIAEDSLQQALSYNNGLRRGDSVIIDTGLVQEHIEYAVSQWPY